MAPIPLLAAVSCTSDDDGIDLSVMNLDACVSGSQGLEGVTPGNPVDYLAFRRQLLGYDGEKVVASGEPATETSEGAACANASEAAVCAQALASPRPTVGFDETCPGCPPSAAYLVFTRRDEVGAVTSLSALASFLAPVGNLASAAFLVRGNGYRVSCSGDTHTARVSGDGFDIIGETGSACGPGDDVKRHLVHVSKAGQISVERSVILQPTNPKCTYGRRPEGFELAGAVERNERATPLGCYFAEAAELEAASVPAFLRMADELTRHGAPVELVKRARAAARDEIRHAVTMKALARRFGAEPSEPVVPEFGTRGLFEIALENAVEGCVHETFAALQATFQARHAKDARIRKVMRRIAEDETRHGALAWSVAEWIEPMLSDAERDRVQNARISAAESMLASSAEPHADVVHVAGAPTVAQAAQLLQAVSSELWAESGALDG